MAKTQELAGVRYEALIGLLRASEAIWESSRLFFSYWDISPSQFNVLNLLRDFPKGCSQTHLSESLIMHRSNVTGLVDRLEKRQLVERLDDPSDRRAFCVRLTPAAEKLLAEILPEYHQAAGKMWSGVSIQRTEVFVRELQLLTQNAENAASRLKNNQTDRAVGNHSKNKRTPKS